MSRLWNLGGNISCKTVQILLRVLKCHSNNKRHFLPFSRTSNFCKRARHQWQFFGALWSLVRNQRYRLKTRWVGIWVLRYGVSYRLCDWMQRVGIRDVPKNHQKSGTILEPWTRKINQMTLRGSGWLTSSFFSWILLPIIIRRIWIKATTTNELLLSIFYTNKIYQT